MAHLPVTLRLLVKPVVMLAPALLVVALPAAVVEDMTAIVIQMLHQVLHVMSVTRPTLAF